MIETNPNVVNFCEHPKELCSVNLGHRVDMWVLFDNEEHFVKISYSKKICEQKTELPVNFSQNNTIRKLVTVTEKEIRSNLIYLSNMKLLLSHIKNRNYPLDLDKHRILKSVGNRPISLLNLELKLPDLTRARVREAIIWLLYDGLLISDLDKHPFGPNTEVCLNV